MYTLVRVRLTGEQGFTHVGYIYDVSQSGMRIELDEALEPGTQVEVRAMLPGPHTVTFTAAGHIIRLHDDSHDIGPVRMGMTFDRFETSEDSMRLSDYLQAA